MFFINLILGLAMMILGYLLMPKPKKEKPAPVSQLEEPVSETGNPWGVVFGDIVVKELQFLWWGDKTYVRHMKKSGKK